MTDDTKLHKQIDYVTGKFCRAGAGSIITNVIALQR